MIPILHKPTIILIEMKRKHGDNDPMEQMK
jgi:hypothetical protein